MSVKTKVTVPRGSSTTAKAYALRTALSTRALGPPASRRRTHESPPKLVALRARDGGPPSLSFTERSRSDLPTGYLVRRMSRGERGNRAGSKRAANGQIALAQHAGGRGCRVPSLPFFSEIATSVVSVGASHIL